MALGALGWVSELLEPGCVTRHAEVGGVFSWSMMSIERGDDCLDSWTRGEDSEGEKCEGVKGTTSGEERWGHWATYGTPSGKVPT